MMNVRNVKAVLIGGLLLVATQVSFAGAISGKVFKDWQGRCQAAADNKEMCFLIQGFSTDQKRPLMVTTIDLVQHPKFPIVTFRVSNLLDDTKGIRFKVDKNNPIGLKAHCTQESCNIAFALDKRMLNEFKRGKGGVLEFFAKDTGKPVYFPLSLSGVTKALNALKKS